MLPDFGFYLYLFEKIAAILGATIYLIFAIIVVKQVSTMVKNVSDKFNHLLVVFAYSHLIFSILLVLLTLIIL